MTAADASQGPQGTISSTAAHLLALWLGVLTPIGTLIQLTYSANYFSKLQQPVVAGAALLLLGMVGLCLRAAFAIWQGKQSAASNSEDALVSIVGANMLACAPLSILMSAPPVFLPVMIISLLFLVVSDGWRSGDARHA